MERVNILIVGAGVIGLAVARSISEEYEDVILVEKENTFGRHTSSRNSEVIHSGIYYPKDSLKAQLCVKGNQKIYRYAMDNKIPFKNCGKLVVANNDHELSILNELMIKGETNGVSGLQIIDEKKCRNIEPNITAKYFFPDTVPKCWFK